jgi:hypothetical protein
MSGDLRELLRSAAGPSATPDHADIRRRGRRLVAVRAVSLAGLAVVVAIGAVGVALGVGGGDDLTPPIIGEPPALPVEDVEEAPQPEDPVEGTGQEIDQEAIEAAEPACAAPDLRPTTLPWLDDGEPVPEPTYVHDGTEERPNGFLVWAEDPDAYDPDGYSEVHTVSISAVVEHEPSGHPDLPDVEVRGHPADLIWVGDTGIAPLALRWQEGPDPCEAYAIHLTIVTLDGVPDFLPLERPYEEVMETDGEHAAIRELEEAIATAMLRIADSLSEQDSR